MIHQRKFPTRPHRMIKSLALMGFGLGIGLVSVHSQAQQVTTLCEAETRQAAIIDCLNTYAKSTLSPGRPADRDFQSRLSRLTAKYGLRSDQVRSHSLADSFSIYLENEPITSRSDAKGLCFDFEKMGPYEKRNTLQRIQRQIDEAASFLADFHARSWGHQVSLLFPIKEISICSQKQNHGRTVLFEQRTLNLGLGQEPLSAREILAEWNSGHPIRSTELSWYSQLPLMDKARAWNQKRQGDYEGILRDKLADNWLALNPTGSLRTTALYTLAEAVHRLKVGIETINSRPSKDEVDRHLVSLRQTIQGPGFENRDRDRLEQILRNPLESEALYRLWQQKIFNPGNILLVIENAIGDQARRDTQLHLVLRKINAGVAIVNDKNIIVRLEQLMQNSIPVSQFVDTHSRDSDLEVERTESHQAKDGSIDSKTTKFKLTRIDPKDLSVNADQVNGGVVIDLIDNVVVSVQVPQISPSTYRRICLYQALEDYVMIGESQEKLP